MPEEKSGGPYQLFMLVLCLYVLGALAAQTVFQLDPETGAILDYADTAICIMFFADFLRNMFMAERKLRYFATWGWLDLVSSIPVIDLFRWGRAARVFRIIRVLRGLRATRFISLLVLERRAASAFWAASLFTILICIFGSIAILQLETRPDGNIMTAGDALWWSFVTITTVGYGDYYPVTPAGRILGGLLMITGIGLFGAFTASLASWFLGAKASGREEELEILHKEVEQIRRSLDRVRSE